MSRKNDSEFETPQRKPGPTLKPDLPTDVDMKFQYLVKPGDTLQKIAEALRAQGVTSSVEEIVAAIIERNRLPSDLRPTEQTLLFRGALTLPRFPTGEPAARPPQEPTKK